MPEVVGLVTRTIGSSGPPTSFQLVTFAVNTSCSCWEVRLFTLSAMSLFTMVATVMVQTLWSTSPFALSAGSFFSAGTSELPMFTEPSATCFRPVPEPPAFSVIDTSGFFVLNLAAASLASGRSADEPETVTCPETLLPEAAPLLAGAEFPPQPAAATNAAEERARAIHFLRFIINPPLKRMMFVFVFDALSVKQGCKKQRGKKV